MGIIQKAISLAIHLVCFNSLLFLSLYISISLTKMQNIAPSNVKQIKNAINQIKSSPNRRGSMFSLTNIQECESNDFNSRLSFSEGGPAYVEKKVEKLENTYIMEPEY